MQGIQESPIQAGKKTESEKQRDEQRLISFEQEQKLENFQKKFQNQDINQSLFDLEQELQKSQNYMLNQINDNKVIMGELVKELEGIDGELKNYQVVLNSNQEKLLIQSNKLRNVNQQREVYETRQQNMLQLQDVLEMLLKPLELNQEEKKILQNSVFTKQSIEQGEAIIQKFINYLKMTEVDTDNLSILSEKQQEIVQILQKFQQKLFRSLEQDSKACLEEYEHNLEKNKFFIDSSVFKFRVEKKKKLFSFLTYLDKENGVEQLVSYFTDEYFNLMEGGMQNLEKRLEKQFGEAFQSISQEEYCVNWEVLGEN
ncbi:hypothetical protein PPERSA_09695 [Pseudocohnilembus persalinus]|uniref:Uncharacterized protein n=1 Tax=Pseudocohnilembus persalinus TaxID=266149 RepID=A0A0V0QUI7_PSEPJ|nr:hypothetical protein PPERSA_09695 [Pseudocohnilembus persalinus]|eukprot:KRX06083.1 hypothetical protein PPERSA_09695 [Pseudocohnilembus persalinus]